MRPIQLVFRLCIRGEKKLFDLVANPVPSEHHKRASCFFKQYGFSSQSKKVIISEFFGGKEVGLKTLIKVPILEKKNTFYTF